MNKTVIQRVCVAFAIAWTSQLFNQFHGDMYLDAWVYLNLATKMVGDKSHPAFSLILFDNALRGYLFPLLLLPVLIVQKVTHLPLIVLTKAFGSIWAAILLGWLFPAFWQKISKNRKPITWISYLLFIASFLLFWGNNLTFTLTDIPSFTLFLLAIWSFEKKGLWWWTMGGGSIAAATNFRPVYVVVLPIIAILIILLLLRENTKSRLLCLMGMIMGLSIVWLPQFLINHHNFNRSTPFVLGIRDTRMVNIPEQENLYLWHLNAGLKVQKFGPALVENSDDVVQVVPDPTGVSLMAQRGGKIFSSYSDYISYFCLNPSRFLTIYAKHLFNGVDVDYNSPYVLRIAPPPVWYCWLNYTLILLGVARLIRVKWKKNYVVWTKLLMFAALIIISLPIVVESRFMFPLHLLLVAAATLGCFSVMQPSLYVRWYRRCNVSFTKYFFMYMFCIIIFFILHNDVVALSTWHLKELKI